jgi:hypothetical protein
MYVRLFGHLIFFSFISALHATVACLRATLSASDNFAASADIGINEPATIAANKDLTRGDAIWASRREFMSCTFFDYVRFGPEADSILA